MTRDATLPMRHRYLYCLPERPEESVAWLPPALPPNAHPDCVYFGRVFAAMEGQPLRSPLTFVLTWDVERLPIYGRDVVVVLLGDELCRFPRYGNRVLAVFKEYGTRPAAGIPSGFPGRLGLVTALAFAMLLTSWLPTATRRGGQLLRGFAGGALPAPVFDIPLGYYNQVQLPLKPFADRQYDVGFAGSVRQGGGSVGARVGTPKALARNRMLRGIEVLREVRPDLAVDLSFLPDFASARAASAEAYSARLMDTKFCLAPRGTSLETFRFFEALRAGCIPVVERLPQRWFYEGSPAVEVDDWGSLAEAVTPLLDDPDALAIRHERARAWWEEEVSEPALAGYIADRLTELTEPAGHGRESWRTRVRAWLSDRPMRIAEDSGSRLRQMVNRAIPAGVRRPPRRAADALLDLEFRFGRRQEVLRALAARTPKRRVLVLCVYGPGDEVVALRDGMSRSGHDVVVRLGARGKAAPVLSEATVHADMHGGKLENVNRLWAGLEEDLRESFDWVIVADDDIRVTPDFLDLFLAVCEHFRLDLAQPAQTRRSFANWKVTRRQPRSIARATGMVEVGPLTAFRCEVARELLPFPELRYGWGLDRHWSYLAQLKNWRQGVVDATPVSHEHRSVGATYSVQAALEESEAFRADHPFPPMEETNVTLRVYRSVSSRDQQLG